MTSDSRSRYFWAPSTLRSLRTTGTLALVAIAAVLGSQNIHAGDIDWEGGETDSNWSTAANWDATLNSVDTLRFQGSSGLTPVNDTAANTVYAGIKFLADAGQFTLSGNAITLGGDIVQQTVGVTQTVALDLVLDDNQKLNADKGDLVISGSISGNFSVEKSGNERLTLQGNNTYTGATTITSGTLNIQTNTALGTTTGGVTVQSGATLELQGDISVGAETLAIKGKGVSEGGALRNISGNNTYAGQVTTLDDNARINSDSGLLTLDVASGDAVTGDKNITFGGAGNILVADAISIGDSDLTKDGAGTLTLAVANTYTGLTTVNDGTLKIGTDNAINSGNAVTVAGETAGSIPVLDLNGFDQTVGLLTFGGSTATSGATVTNSTGTSVLTNTGGITYLKSDNPLGATISVTTLDLDGATQTVKVEDSPTATNDLSISSVVQNGGISKDSGGTLLLSGDNTFSGAVTVNDGVVKINSDTALGTTAGGVTVDSGAALELQGDISVGAEALAIEDKGISEGGALRNISGNNTYGGQVTLKKDARINSDSGLLTLDVASGDAITGDKKITFGGAGNILVADAISIGKKDLTKDGTGTLTLTAANTYTGKTKIEAGVLNIRDDNALGGTSKVKVESGAALELQGGISASAPVLELKGTGVSGDGALRNISGDNTFSGPIKLKKDSLITSDSGLLTLDVASGAAITGGKDVTFGGAGDITVADPISIGGHTVTKEGTGTLTLTGVNTYDGGTIVSEGTLIVAGTGSAITGTVTVASGAAIGGDGQIGDSLDFASGSKFVFSLTDPLTVNGTEVTFGGFSIADLIGLDNTVAANTYTFLDGAATISLANVSNVGIGQAQDLGNGKSAYFQTDETDGSLLVVVIPEPSAVLLFLSGMGALAAFQRRR